MSRPHLLASVLCLVAGVGAGGCTVVKPVIGAVTGPIVMLGQASGDLASCGCGGRGEGVVVVLGIMAAVGATVGLVTGVISDVQALTGAAQDPMRNWWDPFKTNTSSESGG